MTDKASPSRRATFAEPDGRDVIPAAVTVPLKLLEFRPNWDLHALLRVHRIPYRVESLSLHFSMGRPLPLLVHGDLVMSTRAQVFEYLAALKPKATQSTSTLPAVLLQNQQQSPVFLALNRPTGEQ